jgi:hypothetical protein
MFYVASFHCSVRWIDAQFTAAGSRTCGVNPLAK